MLKIVPAPTPAARITRNVALVWRTTAKRGMSLFACAPPKPRKKTSNREAQFVVLTTGMELLPKRKIVFLALMFCVIFSVVVAEVPFIGGHEHDCTGPLCPTCLKIEVKKCLRLAIVALLFAGCFAFSTPIAKRPSWFNDSHISPVMLKVRFNS